MTEATTPMEPVTGNGARMQRAAGIDALGIHKQFKGNAVLRGVDLTVEAGTTVALIGASGSGKSTLCRLMIGLEPIDAGRILVDGSLYCERSAGDRRVRWGASADSLRSLMGMVFQHFTLFTHMTILQNIMLAPMRVRKLSRDEARQRALALLDRVGLSGKADSYPSQLSGGQKQRAAIARELAMERRILFFDEVTSALDPLLVNEVLAVMRELSDTGITMVVVTHEMNFARTAADKIVFMESGVIREEGPPEQIFSNPRTEELRRFLGGQGL